MEGEVGRAGEATQTKDKSRFMRPNAKRAAARKIATRREEGERCAGKVEAEQWSNLSIIDREKACTKRISTNGILATTTTTGTMLSIITVSFHE